MNLKQAKEDGLYKIFGTGKYYKIGKDVSIVYLDLLARTVLAKYREFLSEDLITSLRKLGNKLQDLLEENPEIGHSGQRSLAGKLRLTTEGTGLRIAVTGVEEGFKTFFEDYIASFEKLVIIGETFNDVQYRVKRNGKLKLVKKEDSKKSKSLTSKEKNLYDKVIDIVTIANPSYVSGRQDFTYIAPIVDSNG